MCLSLEFLFRRAAILCVPVCIGRSGDWVIGFIWLLTVSNRFHHFFHWIVVLCQVFTIATGTWTTYDDIDPQYILSDLAGFAGPDGFPYFAGGYSANYTAQTTVFAIHMDTTTNASSPILKIVDHAPLPTARGDVSGVAVQEEGSDEWFALVTGGFTHVDDWCNPLETSERYDFSTQTWTATAALAIPRGDKALVVLETRDRVYALGGESKLPESCDNSVNASLPVNDVEWYNDAENKWSIVADLPRHRFRFAAVGYLFSIYSFGGQLALDPDCNCFKTSNEVVVYTEIFDKNSNGTGTNSGAGGKLFQLGFYLAILVAIVGAI